MNYYQRHLGDYAKDTGWLSTYQHGVYALLLDWYYSNEKPVPVELAYRIVKARTGPERKAVNEVLLAFFDMNKHAGFAHNKHADEVLDKYHVKCAANALIAQEREATKRARNVGELEGGSSVSGEPSHKPIANSQEKAKAPVVPKGDSDESAVLLAYHSALPKCQQITVLNPKRRRRIADAVKLARQVCAGQGWAYVPADFWAAYFAECAADPWLRGERPNPNNPRWVQNLDVLLAEDRFAEIMDKAIAAMRGAA